MNYFICSVIGGMETFRDAAALGISALGHTPTRAEDFGVSSDSPQTRCLAGVRDADAVVLIIGGRYGDEQPSGLAATHEEYREARERCPVLVFIQQGVEREPGQEALLSEVRAWSTGHFTEDFASPDELSTLVTRGLHRLEVARASGPVDDQEMLSRAEAVVPDEQSSSHHSLVVAVASGPRQQVLRPAQIESEGLADRIMQQGLFGPARVLTRELGMQTRIDGHTLLIEQADRCAVSLDELGTVSIVQPAFDEPAGPFRTMASLIEEDIQQRLEHMLVFAGWVLDDVDSQKRLTHVLPLAALLGAGYLPWRTRAEHRANPDSGRMGSAPGRVVVRLGPPTRHRSALTQDAHGIAEDLTVLLRRQVRQ